jgi:hypothetical protein
LLKSLHASIASCGGPFGFPPPQGPPKANPADGTMTASAMINPVFLIAAPIVLISISFPFGG